MTNPVSIITQRIQKIRKRIQGQNLIVVGNKADLVETDKIKELLASVTLHENENIVFISAKKQQNLESLISLLKENAHLQELDTSDVIVSNIRHYEALTKAHEAVVRVVDGLNQNISGDFLAQDIRECLHYLGEITGEISTDEVLGHIFKNFCIGK